MNGVRRIYVEKREGFDVAAQRKLQELRELLRTDRIRKLRIFQRYDVEDCPDEAMRRARDVIFSEPNQDLIYDEQLPDMPGACVIAVEYLPGQFDQRADSAAQCLQLLTGEGRPRVACAVVYALFGEVDGDLRSRVAAQLVNPVEAREAAPDKPDSLRMHAPKPERVPVVLGFTCWSDERLAATVRELGMAMSAADLICCRDYFRDVEHRDPTLAELRVIDTYWSDHCRHTTFRTRLRSLRIGEGAGVVGEAMRRALEMFRQARLDNDGPEAADKPFCLMDMALMGMRELRRQGKLDDLDESDEINACSIRVTVDVDGREEPWLLMFKNETHNHPTEIEGFGGAATCLGGAIRDPLSGRSYVYQAMRISGSGDPRTPLEETLPGKLPQRRITTTAAAGFSSYGNQIGLATGKVQEVYHPGYVAKRLELGAVLGATPRSHVRRETPAPGDVVMLLGGRTGRDGCGGATGSSKAHDASSLTTCGAEVQKGNPPTERSMQRLFRKPSFARLIKRCNDFGAGGVSVAVGELADGLDIDLNAVPKKYDGLDGIELAISESQERMACVIDPEDVQDFIRMAAEENLEATPIARVTPEPRLVMRWDGQTIVDITRAFLDTNGAVQYADALITPPDLHRHRLVDLPAFVDRSRPIPEIWMDMLRDLNVCSQKGLAERFDATIGASNVLAPFGGKERLSPCDAMVSLLPVKGETRTVSIMAHGFDPYLSEWSPFMGAVYAVLHALAKVAAVGGDVRTCRLTLQEYFERLGDDPTRWGKPAAALLGAFWAQMAFGVPAIGGKDSMSGSFEDIDVPPTLVAFAVTTDDVDHIVSQEFQGAGHAVCVLRAPLDPETMLPVPEAFIEYAGRLRDGIRKGLVLSARAVGFGGLASALTLMGLGNMIGVQISADANLTLNNLFCSCYGNIVFECAPGVAAPGWSQFIGTTRDTAQIVFPEFDVSLKNARNAWTSTLESVFPTRSAMLPSVPLVDLTYRFRGPREFVSPSTKRRPYAKPEFRVAKPLVFIPCFPGTNCEADSERAFLRAGARTEVFVMRNLCPQDIEDCARALASGIRRAQIVMLPGGFSAGDEPDGSGKFIATALRHPMVADAITALLTQHDGLMLGICNGFQALIKLGLLPHGEIRDIQPGDPTLTFNTIGRHVATHAYTKVTSVMSPWMNLSYLGEVHPVAISHGEGRFIAKRLDIMEMQGRGQIVAQYCTPDGEIRLDMPANPNGSEWAIEAICSPDGRVLGKMGHSERIGHGVAKNIPGDHDDKIFAAGVGYFAR